METLGPSSVMRFRLPRPFVVLGGMGIDLDTGLCEAET